MKTILSILIILALFGCKEETEPDTRARIEIEQIRQRCDITVDLYEHDQCMQDYASALTIALSEFINVEIYGDNQ